MSEHTIISRVFQSPSAARRLIRKHYFQVVKPEIPPELADYVAISFQPTDCQSLLQGRRLHKVGTCTLVVLSYQPPAIGLRRWSMPLRGYRGRASAEGTVVYGAAEEVFGYDAALVPRSRAIGRAIPAMRHPGLVKVAMALNRACRRHVSQRLQSGTPQLPKVWLGFAPQQPPVFADSLALRQRAARQIGVPLERLLGNPSVLVQQLLHNTWERQLIAADDPRNATGYHLIEAELCNQPRKSLATYEDFTDLVGVHAWNPVRDFSVLELENPAQEILKQFEIDADLDFNQPLSTQTVDRLEQAMRSAIGPQHTAFTQEDIYDALTVPSSPLIPYAALLPRMRRRLSIDVAACCSDEDLKSAVRNPRGPLFASGVPKVQIVRRDSMIPGLFNLRPSSREEADSLGGQCLASG